VSDFPSYYWTSTANAGHPNVAWIVDFLYGGVGSFGTSLYVEYVRAVRSGQSGSFDNFIDHGDGTVTDTDTGLMWQQDTAPSYIYSWQNALTYCEDLSLAGYNDWRLPNINELQSLVDYGRCFPAINTTYFPNAAPSSNSYYWSSTTSAGLAAWIVDFYTGWVYNPYKTYSHYVRAVRSGQCGSMDSSTTTIISGSTTTVPVQPCTTEVLYGEHSDEAELLRYFRDSTLKQTPEGQALIKLYYLWSPIIVKAMEEDDDLRKELKDMIDEILLMIQTEVK
jgi:hypothetical protein